MPPQFSWIDHRLVRDRHIAGKSVEALALYLFLVTVADGQGLSYYSDAGISKLLPLDGPALTRARQELIRARLIAYERPLYQVLSLDEFDPATARSAVTSSSRASSFRVGRRGLRCGAAVRSGSRRDSRR